MSTTWKSMILKILLIVLSQTSYLYISWKNASAIWFIRLMKLYYEGNIPFPIFAPLTFYHFAWIWRLMVLYEGKLIIIIQRTATKRKNDVKDQTIQKKSINLSLYLKNFFTTLCNTLDSFFSVKACLRLITASCTLYNKTVTYDYLQ